MSVGISFEEEENLDFLFHFATSKTASECFAELPRLKSLLETRDTLWLDHFVLAVDLDEDEDDDVGGVHKLVTLLLRLKQERLSRWEEEHTEILSTNASLRDVRFSSALSTPRADRPKKHLFRRLFSAFRKKSQSEPNTPTASPTSKLAKPHSLLLGPHQRESDVISSLLSCVLSCMSTPVGFDLVSSHQPLILELIDFLLPLESGGVRQKSVRVSVLRILIFLMMCDFVPMGLEQEEEEDGDGDGDSSDDEESEGEVGVRINSNDDVSNDVVYVDENGIELTAEEVEELMGEMGGELDIENEEDDANVVYVDENGEELSPEEVAEIRAEEKEKNRQQQQRKKKKPKNLTTPQHRLGQGSETVLQALIESHSHSDSDSDSLISELLSASYAPSPDFLYTFFTFLNHLLLITTTKILQIDSNHDDLDEKGIIESISKVLGFDGLESSISDFMESKGNKAILRDEDGLSDVETQLEVYEVLIKSLRRVLVDDEDRLRLREEKRIRLEEILANPELRQREKEEEKVPIGFLDNLASLLLSPQLDTTYLNPYPILEKLIHDFLIPNLPEREEELDDLIVSTRAAMRHAVMREENAEKYHSLRAEIEQERKKQEQEAVHRAREEVKRKLEAAFGGGGAVEEGFSSSTIPPLASDSTTERQTTIAEEEQQQQQQKGEEVSLSEESSELLAPPDASLLAPPDSEPLLLPPVSNDDLLLPPPLPNDGGLLLPPPPPGGGLLLAPPGGLLAPPGGGLLAPPGGRGLAAPAPRKVVRKKWDNRLRMFNVDKITPNMVAGSVFEDAESINEVRSMFSTLHESFRPFFLKKERRRRKEVVEEDQDDEDQEEKKIALIAKVDPVLILKRALMRRFNLAELFAQINSYDEEAVSVDVIDTIRRSFPPESEYNALQAFEGNLDELDDASRFFKEFLLEVPVPGIKLESWQLAERCCSMTDSLEPVVKDFLSFLCTLTTMPEFTKFIHFLLILTDEFNRRSVRGFQLLSTLEALSIRKDPNDSKRTLLSGIVSYFREVGAPIHKALIKELLPAIDLVRSMDYSVVISELDDFRKDFSRLQQIMSQFLTSGLEDDPFLIRMKERVIEVETVLRRIESLSEDVQDQLKAVSRRFCLGIEQIETGKLARELHEFLSNVAREIEKYKVKKRKKQAEERRNRENQETPKPRMSLKMMEESLGQGHLMQALLLHQAGML